MPFPVRAVADKELPPGPVACCQLQEGPVPLADATVLLLCLSRFMAVAHNMYQPATCWRLVASSCRAPWLDWTISCRPLLPGRLQQLPEADRVCVFAGGQVTS